MKNLLLIAITLVAVSVNAQFFSVKVMYQSPLCYGASTGSVSLQVDGGTAPYSYLWSNGSTTSSLTNLPAGSYTVTVTDASSLVSSNTVVIAEPFQLTANAFVVNVSSQGGSDGAINLTTRGGTYDYAYQWSNGATTEDISNLSAGTYAVTITDGFGCQTTASHTVSEIGGFNVGGFHNNSTSNNNNSNNSGLLAPNAGNAPNLSLSLYPNPSSDFLKVATKEGAEITVMNTNGQVVLSKKAVSDIETLSTADLPNGNYVVRVKNGAEVLNQTVTVSK